MREGQDKKGRPHFYVDYSEEWFKENWWTAAIWGGVHLKKGHTYDRTFAQFQTMGDAEKFEETFNIKNFM
tara:strand:+ start:9115 stop:9324 length:210 start_codon:yes stop_codon:yes gene_type:complete